MNSLKLRTNRDLGQLVAALETWLAECCPSADASGRQLVNPRYVETGGASNETVLVDLVSATGSDERARGLVVRLLVPSVPIFLGVSLERQAAVLRWVEQHTDVPVPSVLGVDMSCQLVDVPFMVMSRIDGVPMADFPSYNEAGFVHQLGVTDRRALWEDAIATMARLHRADASSLTSEMARQGGATDLGQVAAYCRSLHEWVSEVVPVPEFEPYVDWLERELPVDAPPGLSWGDARPGNMLFRANRCAALLDWEMTSLGGPLIDLGWWLMFDAIHSTDMGLTRLPGLGDRDETIERWTAATGLSASALPWHEALAHVQLGLTRSKVYAERAALGHPVPADGEPRSVRRLTRRLEGLIG